MKRCTPLLLAVLCAHACHAAESPLPDLTLEFPRAVFCTHEIQIQLKVRGERVEDAAWTLSKDDTVVAKSGEEVNLAEGILSIKPPAVRSPTTLALNVEARTAGARIVRATGTLRVFPDFRASVAGPITLFSESEAEQKLLKTLGMEFETIGSDIGLAAVKEGMLIIPASASESGLHFVERLREKMRGGLRVLIIQAGANELEAAKIESKPRSAQTDGLFEFPARNGTSLVLMQSPVDGANGAAVVEQAVGKGELIFSSIDFFKAISTDPVARTLFFNLLNLPDGPLDGPTAGK